MLSFCKIRRYMSNALFLRNHQLNMIHSSSNLDSQKPSNFHQVAMFRLSDNSYAGVFHVFLRAIDFSVIHNGCLADRNFNMLFVNEATIPIFRIRPKLLHTALCVSTNVRQLSLKLHCQDVSNCIRSCGGGLVHHVAAPHRASPLVL